MKLMSQIMLVVIAIALSACGDSSASEKSDTSINDVILHLENGLRTAIKEAGKTEIPEGNLISYKPKLAQMIGAAEGGKLTISGVLSFSLYKFDSVGKAEGIKRIKSFADADCIIRGYFATCFAKSETVAAKLSEKRLKGYIKVTGILKESFMSF